VPLPLDGFTGRSDEREGDGFRDWFPYKQGRSSNGEVVYGVQDGTKLSNLIKATKGDKYLESVLSGKKEFDPEDLVGTRFYAMVEESENGKYSRIAWKTIGPVVKKKTTKKEAEKAQAVEEAEAELDEHSMDENNPLMEGDI
jgi:hypothetical protein